MKKHEENTNSRPKNTPLQRSASGIAPLKIAAPKGEGKPELNLPFRLWVSRRSNMMMATPDQVMIRASTKTQAMGELKVV